MFSSPGFEAQPWTAVIHQPDRPVTYNERDCNNFRDMMCNFQENVDKLLLLSLFSFLVEKRYPSMKTSAQCPSCYYMRELNRFRVLFFFSLTLSRFEDCIRIFVLSTDSHANNIFFFCRSGSLQPVFQCQALQVSTIDERPRPVIKCSSPSKKKRLSRGASPCDFGYFFSDPDGIVFLRLARPIKIAPEN